MTLKWEDKGIKSPLARARGLGSAHDGTTHWMHQRITAISNLVLVIWLMISLKSMEVENYLEVTIWLSNPINAILLILTVISTFYHAALGSQVVVEDYIHNEGFKFFKLVGQKLFFFAMAVACIFSILKMAL